MNLAESDPRYASSMLGSGLDGKGGSGDAVLTSGVHPVDTVPDILAKFGPGSPHALVWISEPKTSYELPRGDPWNHVAFLYDVLSYVSDFVWRINPQKQPLLDPSIMHEQRLQTQDSYNHHLQSSESDNEDAHTPSLVQASGSSSTSSIHLAALFGRGPGPGVRSTERTLQDDVHHPLDNEQDWLCAEDSFDDYINSLSAQDPWREHEPSFIHTLNSDERTGHRCMGRERETSEAVQPTRSIVPKTPPKIKEPTLGRMGISGKLPHSAVEKECRFNIKSKLIERQQYVPSLKVETQTKQDAEIQRKDSAKEPHSSVAAFASRSSYSISPDMYNHGSEGRSPARSMESYPRSEGEMPFALSAESDEILEWWEASLDPALIRIESLLVQQLVSTHLNDQIAAGDTMQETIVSKPSSTSSNPSNPASGSGSGSKSSTTKTGISTNGKHRRTEDDDPDDDQNHDRSSRRKRPRVTTELISPDGRLLACPYCKYDPVRYSERNIEEKQYRGCSSSYLTTISRLKQHLYRVHRKPEFYCRSCFEVVETEDGFDTHSRQRPPCEPCEPQFTER